MKDGRYLLVKRVRSAELHLQTGCCCPALLRRRGFAYLGTGLGPAREVAAVWLDFGKSNLPSFGFRHSSSCAS